MLPPDGPSLSTSFARTRAPLREQVIRDDLKRFPRNARSLYGLHESLVKQGRADDAARVKRQCDEAWRDADVTPSLDVM